MWYAGYIAAIVGGKLLARALSHTRTGRWFHDVMQDPWRDNDDR